MLYFNIEVTASLQLIIVQKCYEMYFSIHLLTLGNAFAVFPKNFTKFDMAITFLDKRSRHYN